MQAQDAFSRYRSAWATRGRTFESSLQTLKREFSRCKSTAIMHQDSHVHATRQESSHQVNDLATRLEQEQHALAQTRQDSSNSHELAMKSTMGRDAMFGELNKLKSEFQLNKMFPRTQWWEIFSELKL